MRRKLTEDELRCLLDNETWKPITIDGEDTVYIISNTGKVMNVATSKLLKWRPAGAHYWHVDLYHGDKIYPSYIHRLVAEAFIPNPNNYKEVNHIDGDKNNNNVENLEWTDRSGNMSHAMRNGLHPVAVATPEQVEEVCRLLSTGKYTKKKIGEIVGLNKHTVAAIAQDKAWRSISKNFDFERSKHRPGKLKPYYYQIDRMIKDGHRSMEIIDAIPIKGVTRATYFAVIYERKMHVKNALKINIT